MQSVTLKKGIAGLFLLLLTLLPLSCQQVILEAEEGTDMGGRGGEVQFNVSQGGQGGSGSVTPGDGSGSSGGGGSTPGGGGSGGGGGGGTAPPSFPSVPLADGTEVRILAFRRADPSQADLTKDKKLGDAVYVANSAGKLAPKTSGQGIKLLDGKYDFYAFTPEMNVDAASNAYTIAVDHGKDYAWSLTEFTLTGGNKTVQLSSLKRECAKVKIVVKPKFDNITSGFEIKSATLEQMTTGPLTTKIGTGLDISSAAQTGTVGFVTGDFKPIESAKPDTVAAERVVLPRKKGDFTFKITVNYKNMTKDTELTATVPESKLPDGLKAAYEYTFNVKLEGGNAELWLTVKPWEQEQENENNDLGAVFPVIIKVAEWTDINYGDGTENGPGYFG